MDRRHRPWVSAGTLAVVSSIARLASADVGDSEGNYTPEPSTRRDGLALGTHFGAALGGAYGYPNEVAKIGEPEFEADTGFGAGAGGALWIGLSPRDFFTFGLGLHTRGVSGNNVTAGGTAFMVHLELFPAFYEGGALEDLGLFFEGGAGPGDIIDENDDAVAEGGFMSFVGVGGFWEGLRLGQHFSLGPMVEYTHQFSLTMKANVALVGLRFSYTGGPG